VDVRYYNKTGARAMVQKLDAIDWTRPAVCQHNGCTGYAEYAIAWHRHNRWHERKYCTECTDTFARKYNLTI